jgi:hypothetical protein
MAPKDRKGKAAGGGKAGEDERDEPLQAVVRICSVNHQCHVSALRGR